MTINRTLQGLLGAALLLWVGLTLTSCKVSYSLSGASIAPEVQTVTINYITNNAALVLPSLSPTLTEGLQDRFTRQTRLTVTREGGDMNFEGEITNCSSAPSAVSSNENAPAVQNRLSVTVRIRFTNAKQPEYNFDKSFTAYQDYPSADLLQTVESQLIPVIVEQLVEDIFNSAVSNW